MIYSLHHHRCLNACKKNFVQHVSARANLGAILQHFSDTQLFHKIQRNLDDRQWRKIRFLVCLHFFCPNFARSRLGNHPEGHRFCQCCHYDNKSSRPIQLRDETKKTLLATICTRVFPPARRRRKKSEPRSIRGKSPRKTIGWRDGLECDPLPVGRIMKNTNLTPQV